MSPGARTGECACCGRYGLLTGRGLLRRCHARYQRMGCLGEWPTGRELVEEDVFMVLATGAPYAVVAARCGVTTRTVVRIVCRRRAGSGLPQGVPA